MECVSLENSLPGLEATEESVKTSKRQVKNWESREEYNANLKWAEEVLARQREEEEDAREGKLTREREEEEKEEYLTKAKQLPKLEHLAKGRQSGNELPSASERKAPEAVGGQLTCGSTARSPSERRSANGLSLPPATARASSSLSSSSTTTLIKEPQPKKRRIMNKAEKLQPFAYRKTDLSRRRS